MPVKVSTVIRWSIAIAWTVMFSILLLQPEKQAAVNVVIAPAPPSFERELLFTSLHLLLFAFTAWVWCFALGLSRTEHFMLISLVSLLVIYGASAEMLQSHIPGRSTQIWDMIANIVGIGVGMSLWFVWQQYVPLTTLFGSHRLS